MDESMKQYFQQAIEAIKNDSNLPEAQKIEAICNIIYDIIGAL